MTATHTAAAIGAGDARQAADALRARGHRLTAARRLVIEAVFAAGEPVSGEQIAAGLEGRVPESDPGSVYRNLDLLESIGLVRHVHLGHGPSLYAPAASLAAAYLVCESCGERHGLTDAEIEPVRAALRAAFGFEATFRHFPIAGSCAACAEPA